MSPAAVIVLAWAGLAGVVLLGLVLAVLMRRIDALTRANTDRKWDVVLLRAEVGALRRRLYEVTGASPDDLESDVDDPSDDGAEHDVDDTGDRSGLRRTASPPAWRRDRGRSRSGRPRRRRPA